MVIKCDKSKVIKRSKERTARIGKTSIYNIIYNHNELSFTEKVNYIRHHYTHYEGNYEFFHYPNGKPNRLKFELNELIQNVVSKKVDPKELKVFNKRVDAWRKEKRRLEKEKRKKLLDELNKSHLEVRPISLTTINLWLSKKGPTSVSNCDDIDLVKAYLISKDCEIKDGQLFNYKYKQIKGMAKAWLQTSKNIPEELIKKIQEENELLRKQALELQEMYVSPANDNNYITDEELL